MYSEPHESGTISPIQMEKIDLATQRLNVVQYEVLKATKEKDILLTECVKLEKEKEYREELLSSVNKEIDVKNQEKESLEQSIAEYKTLLKESEETHYNTRLDSQNRESVLSSKEASIAEREAKLIDLEQEHGIKSIILETKKNQVEKAAMALTDAVQLVSWI